MEDGLAEGVEVGDGFPTLGAKRIRFVQDVRDPLLFVKARQWDFHSCQTIEWD